MRSTRATRHWCVVGVLLLSSACAVTTSNSPVALSEREPSQGDGLVAATDSGVDPQVLPLQSENAERTAPDQVTFDDVERFYGSYLQLRANAIDRTDPIEVVDAVTTQAGRREVVDARAHNDGLHDDLRPSAVDALYLYENVDSIRQIHDATILILDCTEQHEVNALGQHLVYWQANEVRIDTSTGQLLVDSFTTTHNGYLDVDDPVGCAPISFRERAEATAAYAWTELTEWGRNADDRNVDALSPVIGDPLRELVASAADTPETAGFAIEAHAENTQFAAAGIDTLRRLGALGPEGVIVHVDSCHFFPDGRGGFDPVTQRHVDDLAPGAQQALRFFVQIDTSSGDDRLDQVVAIEYVGDRCL